MTTFNLKLDDVWSEVKSLIKKSEHFDETIYQTYFDNSRLSNIDGKTAVISVESYFQQVILSNEVSVISRALGNILNVDDIDCEVVIQSKDNVMAQFVTSKKRTGY